MTDASSSPMDVAKSYFASFDRRDPDQIAGHVAPDFVNEHTAALGTGCTGRDAYRERLPAFLDSMVALHYEVENAVSDGDEVAVFYAMTGRWQGEADFAVRGAQHLVIRDGLIARRTDYWDSAAFLVQVNESAATALAAFGIT